MYTSEQILAKLRPVMDPELGLSIVDLGLIYAAEHRENGTVVLRMSLTTPACPLGPALKQQVIEALASDPEVTSVEVEWTFDPPWTVQMAASEARRALGLDG